MKNFFVDFRTFQKTTQFYSDIGSKLYIDEAPQNVSLPYAVFTFPYGTPDYDLERKEVENISAQLDIYAKGASEIMDLFDEANASFNGAKFVVTGYQMIEIKRVAQRRLKEDNVRRYILEFSIQIGEN